MRLFRQEGVYDEGVARAEENGEWFHAWPDGTPLYPQRYIGVDYFRGGLAWVQKKDFTFVKINLHGQEVPMKDTQNPRF